MNSLSVFIEKFETFIVRLATAERMKIYPRLIFTIGILTWGILILGGNGVIDAAGNLLGEDFLSFYTIARFYIEDNLHLFYDTAAQKAYHSTITGDEQGVGAFLNPPFVALLYYPFGTGSYLQGILTWWAFGILLFLSSLYLLQKYLLMDRMDYKGVITISLLFMPTVYWLAYGQISGILFFILALSFIFLREGKEYTAGFVLGLLAFKPQIALGLALPILFKFRWRAIIGGITSSTIWILLGLWLFPDQMAQYILERKEILSYIYDPNFPSWGVHTQYGFFHLLFRDVNAEIINIISWFFFFVSVAWLYWIWRPIDWETKSPSWNLMIAISLVMGLSVSIHLYVYDLMLLLIPFYIALVYVQKEHKDGYLDAGPIYAWTVLVYITACTGSVITKGQLFITEFVFGSRFGFQLSTVAMIGWIISVSNYLKRNSQRILGLSKPY